MKTIVCETFCHGISCHFVRQDILEDNATIFDTLTDKMMLDIDMFGSRLVLWILGEGNRALIVGVDNVRVGDRDSDL